MLTAHATQLGLAWPGCGQHQPLSCLWFSEGLGGETWHAVPGETVYPPHEPQTDWKLVSKGQEVRTRGI